MLETCPFMAVSYQVSWLVGVLTFILRTTRLWNMARSHTLLGFRVEPMAEIDSSHVGLARVPTIGFEYAAVCRHECGSSSRDG